VTLILDHSDDVMLDMLKEHENFIEDKYGEYIISHVIETQDFSYSREDFSSKIYL
jgi:hypothetical protein